MARTGNAAKPVPKPKPAPKPVPKAAPTPAPTPAAPRARPALDPMYTPSVVKYVKDIMVRCEQTGEYQSGLSMIVLKLKECGICWDCRLQIDHVGVSPFNRGGLGVAAGDAQKHLLDMSGLGFTWDKLEAYCKQLDQFDPTPEEAFNKKQVQLSKGLIPPLALLEAVSLGGSHTNVGFRQAKGRVRSLHKKLAGPDGNLDPDRLVLGRPEMGDAMANGLKWTKFHWQVDDAWPGFSQFVQKALNVEAKSMRGEAEIFLEMWELAVAGGLEHVAWGEIEELVAKALSPCSGYIPAMSKYLQVHSGGLLQQMNIFLKAFERDDTQACLGGEYIYAVADLDLRKTKIPHVAAALLEAQFLSSKVVDGMCRSIPLSKVSSLKKDGVMRAKVLQAEKMMQDARLIGAKMNRSEDSKFVRQLGFLDVRCISVLLNLGKTFEAVEWESLDDVSKAASATNHFSCFCLMFCVRLSPPRVPTF